MRLNDIDSRDLMAEEELVEVSLLFFAKSRELAGTSESQILIPTTLSFQQLKQQIVNHYPDLAIISENIILSLNQEYIDDASELHLSQGDEIAVIPPISGG